MQASFIISTIIFLIILISFYEIVFWKKNLWKDSLWNRINSPVERLGRTWAKENFGRIVMEEGRSKEFIKVGKRLKVPRLVSGLPQNREPSLEVVIMIDVFHIQNHLLDESVLMPRFVGHRFTRCNLAYNV